MNFSGLLIGMAVFGCIGVFHPIVIKAEYHWGTKSWWLFAAAGVICCLCSIFTDKQILSILLGVIAFSCFWSIGELFQQKKRVERGWFPKKPQKK